jgi:hypothetical protein
MKIMVILQMLQKGRDITVEVIPAKETGKMFNTTTVRVKPNQTPLVEKMLQLNHF